MSRRRAFIIGENGPADASILPLSFAEQDALRLAKVLSSDSLGYDVVYSVGRAASEHLNDLDTFASQTERDDFLLIYFSGHGYLPRTGLYLLCKTTSLKSRLTTTAIPLSTVRNILENCMARRKLLILDCCHSGAAASNVFGTKGATEKPGERLDVEARDAASLVMPLASVFRWHGNHWNSAAAS